MKSTNEISRLKKAFITIGTSAALILGSSAILHAGQHSGQRGDSQHSGKMQQRLLQELDLTDAQQAQIESIHASYKPQMMALRDSHKALKKQHKKLDPASSNYVAEVQAQSAEKARLMQESDTLRAQMQHETALVLTQEQRAEMAQLRAERQEKMQERRENRGERRQQHREDKQD